MVHYVYYHFDGHQYDHYHNHIITYNYHLLSWWSWLLSLIITYYHLLSLVIISIMIMIIIVVVITILSTIQLKRKPKSLAQFHHWTHWTFSWFLSWNHQDGSKTITLWRSNSHEQERTRQVMFQVFCVRLVDMVRLLQTLCFDQERSMWRRMYINHIRNTGQEPHVDTSISKPRPNSCSNTRLALTEGETTSHIPVFWGPKEACSIQNLRQYTPGCRSDLFQMRTFCNFLVVPRIFES